MGGAELIDRLLGADDGDVGIAEVGLGGALEVGDRDGLELFLEDVVEVEAKTEGFVGAVDLGELGVGLFAQGVLAEEFGFADLEFFGVEGRGGEAIGFKFESFVGDFEVVGGGADVEAEGGAVEAGGVEGGDVVGETLFFAEFDEEAAGHAVAEVGVEEFHGAVVGVMDGGSQVAEHQDGLVGGLVLLDPARGAVDGGELLVGEGAGGALPGAEGLFDKAEGLVGGDVSGDADDQVVGAEVLLVVGEELVAIELADGGFGAEAR